MSNAKIDENRERTKLATNTNGNPANLLVDPATDRLLVEVTIVSSTTPEANRARIDENREWVSQAVDDNGDIKPLLVDNRNGLLWVDLIVE